MVAPNFTWWKKDGYTFETVKSVWLPKNGYGMKNLFSETLQEGARICRIDLVISAFDEL